MQRNKELRKDCCEKPDNYVFRSFGDQSAELRCKKCGYVIRSFDAPNLDKPKK